MSETMIIATFSGVRWIHDTHFESNIRKYVSAYCHNIRNIAKSYPSIKFTEKIVVGLDGRSVGQQYPPLILNQLLKHGFEAEFIGVVPTPTVQQMVQLHSAIGGIIVTASHNPGNWCGLKFVNPSSIFLTPAECDIVYGDLKDQEADTAGEAVMKEVLSGTKTDKRVKIVSNDEILREHINHVFKSPFVAVDKIKARNFKIAFSGCNASGAAYIKPLSEMLNLKVVLNYGSEVGPLPKTPEPTPANLQEFSAEIKKLGKIDVGFAVDPDADRCVVINEDGEAILEELTLAMCAGYCQGVKKGQVVKNVSTSLATDAAAGVSALQTAVGEVNVAIEMGKHADCYIGGEGNGGVILKDAHLGRDSIVAICLVLSLLATQKNGINAHVASMRKYDIVKMKYEFDLKERPTYQQKLDALKAKMTGTWDIITLDGVKLENKDKGQWVHCRFSNTEPIMRIIAEAPDVQQCKDLISMVEKEMGFVK